MLEKETEVSKELKFFNKRGRKKCSKNNRIIGLALNASQTRGKRKEGSEVQHWGWRERQQLRLEAEELLQMVLTAANHPPKEAGGTRRPPPRGGEDGAPRHRIPPRRKTRWRQRPAAEESTGLRVGCLGKALRGPRQRPGGPGAARAAGEPTPGPSLGRGSARSPKGRQWGVGEGPW